MSTKRYYAKFDKGGCPDLYVVVDSSINEVVSDAKPYHEANLEAGARNDGKEVATTVAEGMGRGGFIPAAPLRIDHLSIQELQGCMPFTMRDAP